MQQSSNLAAGQCIRHRDSQSGNRTGQCIMHWDNQSGNRTGQCIVHWAANRAANRATGLDNASCTGTVNRATGQCITEPDKSGPVTSCHVSLYHDLSCMAQAAEKVGERRTAGSWGLVPILETMRKNENAVKLERGKRRESFFFTLPVPHNTAWKVE